MALKWIPGCSCHLTVLCYVYKGLKSNNSAHPNLQIDIYIYLCNIRVKYIMEFKLHFT